jgi:hypothetical protein
MPAHRADAEDPAALEAFCAPEHPPLPPAKASVRVATEGERDGGLATTPIRDSLIDALLRGDEPRELHARAEHTALAARLAALRVSTASAGDEIASHIVRFIARTESFALAIERMKTLPEEIASAPVLLTEICEGLTRIAAIGRDLSRATRRDTVHPARRPSFAPPYR